MTEGPRPPCLHHLQHTIVNLPRLSVSGTSESPVVKHSVLYFTPPPGSPHTATVLLLHGLGGTGLDLKDAVEDALGPRLPWVKFVLPTAETKAVTLNMGAPLPAWYDVVGSGGRTVENCPGIEEARALINCLLEVEHSAGIPPHRCVVAGFSQGGALSLYSALCSPTTLGGALCIGGYMPCPSGIRQRATPASLRTPIRLAHGSEDPVVLPRWAASTHKELQRLGCATADLVMYDGVAHSVSAAMLEDAGEWLTCVVPNLDSKKAQKPSPKL